MKRTKIKYRDLGDQVEILGWENCASRDDLQGFTGKYFRDNSPYYAMVFFPDNIWINDRWGALTIGVGDIIRKRKFHRIIKTMKLAGNRLTKIIAEEKAKRVHEILI